MAGLHKFGFFSAPGLPGRLASAELVMENLCPVLGFHGGVVTAKDLLFLESDHDKRQHLKRDLELLERFGQEFLNKKKQPKAAERVLFAHQRWTAADWSKAHWDGEHGSSHALRTHVSGAGRPSSAPASHFRKPASESPSRRPASASRRPVSDSLMGRAPRTVFLSDDCRNSGQT